MATIPVRIKQVEEDLINLVEQYNSCFNNIKEEFKTSKGKERKWWGGRYNDEDLEEEFKIWQNCSKQGQIFYLSMSLIKRVIDNLTSFCIISKDKGLEEIYLDNFEVSTLDIYKTKSVEERIREEWIRRINRES